MIALGISESDLPSRVEIYPVGGGDPVAVFEGWSVPAQQAAAAVSQRGVLLARGSECADSPRTLAVGHPDGTLTELATSVVATEAAWAPDGSAVAYVDSYGPLFHLLEDGSPQLLVAEHVVVVYWAPTAADLILYTTGRVPRDCS